MDARVLGLLEDVIGLTDLAEFRSGLLDALLRVVPSDWASLNDVGPNPADFAAIVVPEPPPWLLERFPRYMHQNPIIRYMSETQDGRAYRISDFISDRELRALDLYREVYGPLGNTNYQIAFTLPHTPGRILGIALSRGAVDYGDDERDLLNRARPALIQVFRNAIEHEAIRRELAGLRDGTGLTGPLRVAGLTAREAEILRLVALGRSSRDIAAALGISDRTVGKHLERGFRKLGVATRSAAAARVWDLAGGA